jgi:O-antigen/teichoic acid export membrane protein
VFANFLVARVGIVLIFLVALDGLLVLSGLYSPELTLLILLLSIGQLGDGVLLLSQSLFIAHNRVRLVLSTAVVVSVLRIALGLAVMVSHGGLYRLALAFVVPSLLGAAIASGFAVFGVLQTRALTLLREVDFRFIWNELGHSASFFLISLFVIVEFQADVLLVSVLRSVPEVALYNAALTFMIAAWIIPQAFRAVIYPRMSRARQSSSEEFWRYFRITIGPAVALGLCVSGALALFSGILIGLIYPPDYAASAAILRILVIPLFFAFLSAPSTRALLTLHRESVAAALLGIGMAVNLAANLLLIPRYGPTGAAVARAASGATFCLLTYAYLFALRKRPSSG